MSQKLKAHIALFFVALIYGANFTIAKVVMDEGYIEPLGFILLRVLSGLILFSLIHWFFVKEKIERKDIGKLILCGLLGVAVNQMFFFQGLKLTTPINASLIMTTCPIFVLIVSAIILKEKVTPKKILGILFGACGAIILITYGQKIQFQKNQALGDLMILVNAISFGTYLVLVKSLMKKYHPITVVKWVFTIGIIFVFPFGIKQLTMVEWSSFSTNIWVAVAYVLLFTTFLTYLFNAFALKIVQASTTSIYIYLQPLIASLIAILAGGDELVPVKLISGFLIFIGVYLVSTGKVISKK